MSTIDDTAPTVSDPWAEAAPKRLSPSSASDFKQCPRMWRHKVIDRLPDPGTLAQARGTLVHAVLEWLYQQPPAERTLAAALDRAPGEWQVLFNDPDSRDDYPRWFPQWGVTHEQIVEQGRDLLRVYFQMEDPVSLGAPIVEQDVKEVISGVPVRGKIDRTDVAPDGQVRIVDYKTGKAPNPRYAHEALWQLKFYALLWRFRHGVLPARLRLVYLGGNAPQFLEHSPTTPEIDEFEQEIIQLWRQINTAYDSLDFPAKPGPLCPWCPFQSMCEEGSRIRPRSR